ncbi:MAG: DUF58 domain-containing protein [Lentisphaeria bacterium]|nr:DUF58 domain-containing protein [Lentisphaeria bacterium]NQZ68295.1 DUF58 domain-containing protein [Lentisphaeria bacterium]
MKNSYKLDTVLSAEAKESLKHLEMHARSAVQGLLHGIHGSKRIGTSTDFDHHKIYMPGDPIKHIDWKMSARSENMFIKRYTEDTALSVRIVLDRSASMSRQSEDLPTKYFRASQLAACLAYLTLNQKDSVGMVMASSDDTLWLPVSSTQSSLVRILEALVGKPPSDEDALVSCLKAILDRGEKRGLIAVVSDLMFDPKPVMKALSRLGAQGHEILIFQVKDPDEEEFPYNRWVDFQDLESGKNQRIDTVPLKRLYREEYKALMDEWQSFVKKNNAHIIDFKTDQATETVLSEYMIQRSMGDA